MRIFHVGLIVCFFPADFISFTYTNKNNPFSQCTNKNIPNSELFPNRTSIELSRIAVPIIVLPEEDRTDFAQEERLGLPYWTMILAIWVLVDVSKYLDILTLEFPITSVHLPFWPGYERILRLLLVLRIPVVLKLCPWLLRLSSVMLMLHNVSSEYDSAFVLLILRL